MCESFIKGYNYLAKFYFKNSENRNFYKFTLAHHIIIFYTCLFYYLPMSNYPMYTQARATMFKKNPPEFVYSSCALYKNKLMTYSFKEYATGAYEVFYYGKSPTCLYIRKSAVRTITKTKWDSIKQFGYNLKQRDI